jgi:Phage P22-like portal protein
MARKPSDEELIATCRKRLQLAQSAEQEIRAEALIDLQFAAGEQWDAEDEHRRNSVAQGGKRPCLTFNKLTGPLNMVANELRMNKPGLQAMPVDSSGDSDTALVIEGMIRHIEYASKAEQVYETALEQSTKGAIGAWRVVTKYCSNKTFDQELRIERITNPFSVFMDPFAQQADKSDAMWAIELEWVSREDYTAEFGDSEVAKANFYAGGVNPAPEWIGKEGVQIARYWYVEIEVKKLVGIEWPDGRVTAEYESDLPDDLPPGVQYATGDDGKRIERGDQIRHVRMCRINGVEILDRTEWKGQYIPILIVLGEEMYIEEKRYVFSLIRFARDPQKLYNFYRSSEAETVMLGTKAPWVGAKGVFKDPRWATANTIPWAYLEYEPLDIAGNPAPPPQRNLAEPPIQALSIGAAQASDDIKATTNIYDASLGQMSNETSGVAIRQRQSQGGLSNFHFIDNLNRAILQCGTILVDLIPKIYDTPREVRILGEDQKEKIVKVNQQYVDEQEMPRLYDLKAAKYDVRLKIGPNWKTDQEKASEMLTQLAQAYPPLMQVAGDIIFDNLNFKGADKIAERLRRTLPPALQEKPDQKPQELLAQQNQQMAMQIDQMTQQLQQMQREIETKQADLESRERIEQAKIESSDRQAALEAQVKLVTTEAQLTSREDISALTHELSLLKTQIASMATGAAAEQSTVGPAPGEPAAGMEPPPAAPFEQQQVEPQL